MSDFQDPASKVFPDTNPDGCPPDETPFAECKIYRIVNNDPPREDEFPTWAEQGKIIAGRECECHGVSVFSDKSDAEFYAEKYPHLGELIAAAKLSPHHGKLASTPRKINGVENSHSTWWPFVDVVRHALFAVVKE